MNIYRRVKQMSKHLAKPEKTKKNPVIDFSAKEIHIPEKKQKKKTKSHVSKAEDTFQTAMLNKTLDRKFSLSELALAIAALVLLVVVNFLPTSGIVRLLSFLVPFLLAGYSYLFEAFQEAFIGIVLGRELIVTVASLMAFCAGSYNGGAAVMIFLKLSDMALAYAEMMQAEKVNALYSLRPEKANLVNENTVSVVKAETLKKDQIIELYAGDIVPTDGVVIDGTSVLDASTLVGGSLSFPVAAGSTAISGCVNVTAPIRVRVATEQKDAMYSAVLRAAENSWMHKSSQERLIQKVVSYLTPALVIAAFLLAIVPSISTGDWRTWVARAAVILTVSQLYSVVQSVKLVYDCAAVYASARGIVFKGHDVIEALSRAETLVFDKTGTVTEGKYQVKDVFPKGVSESQLLFLAGAAELSSNHPIARAIVAASGAYASDVKVLDVEETPGRGVCAFIDGRNVYVGNAAMMEEHGVEYDMPTVPGSAIHVAIDGRYIGHIIVDDALRDGAFDAIEELRMSGAKTSVLLTGDVHSSARKIASVLNFDLVKAELSPDEKCKAVEYLMSNRNVNTTLAFVGDGICDTDVLKCATVGIAMGCFDKPDAVEACDIAILGDDIHQLPKAYQAADRAAGAAFLNTVVCSAVKLLIAIFGAAGVVGLAAAAFLQCAAVMFESINALRILNYEENRQKPRIKWRKGRLNHERSDESFI
ncbi:MAG TPA: hypothetical protein DCM61_07010 [Clostridiales bacterium]|nr:hypothetical protein [Clostridiales bacterium]